MARPTEYGPGIIKKARKYLAECEDKTVYIDDGPDDVEEEFEG